MKILHTSDLHLGAKTENKSRLLEQKDVLFEIVDICNAQKVDIVALSGDIFHTATPSAEAEDLFYEFLEKLTKNDDRVVLVVAGNHDDPNRLSACLPLAKRHNIVICSDLSPLPSYPQDRSPAIVKADRGFVEIEKNGETVCAALLPYATRARLDFSLEGENLESGESYEKNIETWSRFVCKNFKKNAFNMLVTHLYLVGAEEEREGKRVRVKLGDSLAVPANILPEADYTAVGHLHTCQKIAGAKNVYYSGATTKLRLFDSAPKVLLVDTKTAKVKEIVLEKAFDIVEVSAKDAQDAAKKLSKTKQTDLVYLKFLGISFLDTSAIKELFEKHPNIISIRFERQNESVSVASNAKNLSPKDLFVEFFKAKTGDNPDDELVEAFLEVLEDKNEADIS